MCEMREKILRGWTSLSDNAVMENIAKGVISIKDLETTIATDKDSKSRTRLENIKKQMKDKDQQMWAEAVANDTIEAYRAYVDFFGDDGVHSVEAKKKIKDKDYEAWKKAQECHTLDAINGYLNDFPDGDFVEECRRLADDLPWYETKDKNTINAYNEYKKKYPGKHDKEADQLIEKIEDENDWNTACKLGNKAAYQDYLDNRPGKLHAHKEEAEQRITNVSGRDLLLDELRKNIDAYSVVKLKEKVENNVVTWEDLEEIFTKDQIEAIQNYTVAEDLPIVTDYHKLPRGYTEVYFWGLRRTGKTCAIGATVGYLQHVRKSLDPIICPGQRYLFDLVNLFQNDGNVCTLPKGSPTGTLPCMAFSFRDKVKPKAYRKAMLIDVAGEVFSGIFKVMNGVSVAPDEQEAIDHLKRCLTDSYNNKIHFFIIEYGNDDLLNVSGYGKVKKSQIMQSLVQYFAEQKLFRKSSVSMNILVTKCDRIKKEEKLRVHETEKYIENSNWGGVKNHILKISEQAHTGGIKVKAFSIGNVFLQDLCIFNPSYAEKIIDVIEEAVTPDYDTWWGRLLKAFKS